MGRKPVIDEATGERLIAAYGRLGSQAAAAREVGIGEDTANRFFAALPRNAAPAVATQQQIIETAGASLFDVRAQLQANFDRLQLLVVQAQANNMANPKAIAAAAGVMREIRAHIESGLDLYKLMIDVDEVRAFQQTVLEAIGEADEPTRQRIIENLRQRLPLGLLAGGGR